MKTLCFKKTTRAFIAIRFLLFIAYFLTWITPAFAIVIKVPPSEFGLTPTVEIDNNGNVILDFIQRSLKHGVPKYTGPAGYPSEDILEFKIGEFSGELVFIKKDAISGFYLYKPKREGSFLKFYYDNSNNRWRVFAQSGAVWELGSTPTARDEAGGKTFMWFINKIADSNNNNVLYDYLDLANLTMGVSPKLKRIRYNIFGSKNEAFSIIEFNWRSGTNSLSKLSYATGYPTVLDAMTLDNIIVKAIGYDSSNNRIEDKQIIQLKYYIDQTQCADNKSCAFRKQIKYASSNNGQQSIEYAYYAEPDKLNEKRIYRLKPIEHGSAKTWIAEKYKHFKNTNPSTNETLEQWLNTSDLATLSQTFTTSVNIDEDKKVTSWIQTSHKPVDMDGDGDLDMLVANKDGWFWRSNNNGVWSQKDYLAVTFAWQPGDPAFIDPAVVSWGKQHSRPLDSYLIEFEVSNNILQDVFDITGDGKPDLLVVWAANRTLYVSKGNGQGFDRPQPWWVFPKDVPLSLSSVESRPVKTNISRFSDVSEEKIRIIDLNGDNLVDYLYVKEIAGQYSWDVYFNTGSGFATKPVSIYNGRVHGGIKITQRINYAVITVQDLLDVNGDKITDLVTATYRDIPDKVFKASQHNIVVFDQGFKNNNIVVYSGTGNGFDFSSPLTFSKYPGMERIETRMIDSLNEEFRDHSGFYDVNGDGLVDYLIAVDFNYIRHIDPNIKRIDPLWESEVIRAKKADPYDLSPTYDKARIYVYYNKGGGYFAMPEIFLDIKTTGKDRNELPVSLSAGDWVSSDYVIASYATVRQGILDMNGNGQKDFINCYSDWNKNYNKLKTITVDPKTGIKATFNPVPYDKNKLGQWLLISPEPEPIHRLKKVITSKGQVTELEYSLGAQNNRELPFPLWTIAKIKNSDLVTNTERILQLNNYFPVFSPEDREFRGFKLLAVTQVDTGNSENNRTTFHNYKTGRYDAGIEYMTTVHGRSSGQTLSRIDRGFEVLHLDSFYDEFGDMQSADNTYSTRVWVRPVSVKIYQNDSKDYLDKTKQSERYISYEYWDSPQDNKKNNKKYSKNGLGLIKRIIDKGDNSSSINHRITELNYKWIDTNAAYTVRTETQKLKDVNDNLYKIIKYDYDGNWNLIKESELIDFNPFTHATSEYLNYDKYGRPGVLVDPDNRKTYYEYYSNTPYLSKIYRKDKNKQEYALIFKDYHTLTGQPRIIGGPAYKLNQGVKTYLSKYFEYDSLGRITREHNNIDFGDDKNKHFTLVQEIEYADNYSATTTPYRHTKVYPDGNNISATDVQESREYINSFDELILRVHSHPEGWVKQYFDYNLFGEINAIYEPFLSSSNKLTPADLFVYKAINIEYDKIGRPIEQRNFAGHKSRLEYKGKVISFYDELDNASQSSAGQFTPPPEECIFRLCPEEDYTSAYNKNQPSTSFTLNGFNEIVSIASELKDGTVESKYAYHNITGALENVTDADQGIFRYAYYPNDLLKNVVLPGAQRWSYKYTPAGLLKQTKRSDNSKTELEYYELGQIKSNTTIDRYGNITQHTLLDYYKDPQYLGQLKSVSDNEYRINLKYGINPNRTVKTLVDRSTRRKLSAAYQYNILGDVTAIEYPDKRVLQLSYDNSGNLHVISDQQNLNTVFCEFEYRADDHIKNINGYLNSSAGKLTFNRDYLYNINHRLKKQTSMIDNHKWSTEFDYWLDGNIKSHKTTEYFRSIKNIFGNQYYYDRLNRLTKSEAINSNLPVSTYEYTYNDNGTLNTVNEDGRVWLYEYLNNQNHTLKKLSLQGGNEHYLFSYGIMGQRQKEFYETRRDGAGTVSEHLYEWNPDGSIHTITEKQKGVVASRIQSKYTHAGERWRKILQKGRKLTTSLYLDDLFELEQSTSAARPSQIIYNDHIPIGDVTLNLSSNGEKHIRFGDGASVSYTFRNNNARQSRHTYSPYGRNLGLGGLQNDEEKYGYSGKERDGNVLFYGARHYDPVSRQFLSIDPLSKSGFNIENYLLSGSNPVNRIDPDGRDYYDISNGHVYLNPAGPPVSGDHYGPWSGIPGGAYVGPHDWFGSSNFHRFSGNRYVDWALDKAYKGINAATNTAGFIVNLIPNSMHKLAVGTQKHQNEMAFLYLGMSLYQAYITGGGNFAQLQGIMKKLSSGARNQFGILSRRLPDLAKPIMKGIRGKRWDAMIRRVNTSWPKINSTQLKGFEKTLFDYVVKAPKVIIGRSMNVRARGSAMLDDFLDVKGVNWSERLQAVYNRALYARTAGGKPVEVMAGGGFTAGEVTAAELGAAISGINNIVYWWSW